MLLSQTSRELGQFCSRCRSKQLLARPHRLSQQTRCNQDAASTIIPPSQGSADSVTCAEDRNTSGLPISNRQLPAQDFQRRSLRRAGTGYRLGSLAVFQSIVGEQVKLQEDSPPLAPAPQVVQFLEDVATLEVMVRFQKDKTTAECFTFFDKNLFPKLGVTQTPKRIIAKVAGLLIHRATMEKVANFEAPGLPTVTHIGEVLLSIGELKSLEYIKMMQLLIQKIVQISPEPVDHSSVEAFDRATLRREALQRDLLGTWKILFAHKKLVGNKVGYRRVAAELDFPIWRMQQRSGPQSQQAALANLFPLLATTQEAKGRLLRALLASFLLVSHPLHTSKSIRIESAPLALTLRAILILDRPTEETVSALFKDDEGLRSYILSQWPVILRRLDEPRDNVSQVPSVRRACNVAEKMYEKAGEALRTVNRRAVNEAWAEFWGRPPLQQSDEKHRKYVAENANLFQECAGLFDFFSMAFMALHDPAAAIHAWRAMLMVGIKPTIRSWMSMMEGCRRANNPDGIENVWKKLLESGTPLDTAIWTSRISGLIEAGRPREGLQALADMVQIWKHDRDKPDKKPVRPSCVHVNSALSGLLRLKHFKAASDLLHWADQQGIKPDIYTLNTMLRLVVQRGDAKGVDRIFRTMNALGIQADDATGTIMVHAALTGLGRTPVAEQDDVVKDAFVRLKAAGLQFNLRTYGKMVHTLLVEYGDMGMKSVLAVLGHLRENDMQPSTYIYTILVNHFFTRDPPNCDAVRALIESRGLMNGSILDRSFWERVISGYSQAGYVDAALEIYEHLLRFRTDVTPSTLYDLLLALIQKNKMEAAKTLVATAETNMDVKMEERGLGRHDDYRGWCHRFWNLAKDYGLTKH